MSIVWEVKNDRLLALAPDGEVIYVETPGRIELLQLFNAVPILGHAYLRVALTISEQKLEELEKKFLPKPGLGGKSAGDDRTPV